MLLTMAQPSAVTHPLPEPVEHIPGRGKLCHLHLPAEAEEFLSLDDQTRVRVGVLIPGSVQKTWMCHWRTGAGGAHAAAAGSALGLVIPKLFSRYSGANGIFVFSSTRFRAPQTVTFQPKLWEQSPCEVFLIPHSLCSSDPVIPTGISRPLLHFLISRQPLTAPKAFLDLIKLRLSLK